MQRYKDRYDYRIQIVVHQSGILEEVQDHSCRSTTAHSKRSQEKDIYFKVKKTCSRWKSIQCCIAQLCQSCSSLAD